MSEKLMSRKYVLGSALAFLGWLNGSLPADSAVWNFTYSNTDNGVVDISASGQILTDATGTNVIAMTGVRNGLAITLLPANSFPPGPLSNNNLFYPDGDPYFIDYYGLSYITSDNRNYNFFFNTDPNSLSYTEDSTGSPSDYRKLSASFTLQVPEPSSLFGVLLVVASGFKLNRR
jgi:hypothetical protein